MTLCVHMPQYCSDVNYSGIDVQITELRKWDKMYGNQSIMIAELSPIPTFGEIIVLYTQVIAKKE